MREWLVDPYEWEKELPAGLPIHLVNRFGDLRVRGAESRLIQVIGYTQHHRDDPRPIEVEATMTNEGLRFEVQIPETEHDAEAPAAWSGHRADFTVYVPIDSPLSVETSAGVLEAQYVGDELEAVSESGEISVSGRGVIRARSNSGAVHGILPDPSWAGTLDIFTQSGDVELWLRRDADLEIRARTRGPITTDFSLEIVPEELGVRSSTVQIGEGTGKVTIESYQGAVTFQEIEVVEEQLAQPASP